MDIVDAGPGHAAAIAGIYAPSVTDSAVSFEDVAPDAAEIERRMVTNRPWLVAVSDGEVVGYAYAAPFKSRHAYRYTVETTVYVAPGHQRRGVATTLSQALFDRLAAGGIHTAVAVIALPNPASVATAEATGFSHVGTIPAAGFKQGRWIDVGFWTRPV